MPSFNHADRNSHDRNVNCLHCWSTFCKMYKNPLQTISKWALHVLTHSVEQVQCFPVAKARPPASGPAQIPCKPLLLDKKHFAGIQPQQTLTNPLVGRNTEFVEEWKPNICSDTPKNYGTEVHRILCASRTRSLKKKEKNPEFDLAAFSKIYSVRRRWRHFQKSFLT